MCRCVLISILLAFFTYAIIFTNCTLISCSSNLRYKTLAAFEPVMNCVIYFPFFSLLLLTHFGSQLFFNHHSCFFFKFLKFLSHFLFQFINLILHFFIAFLYSAEISNISLKVKLGIFCFLQLELTLSLKSLLAKLIELFLISDENDLVLMIDEGELIVFIVLQFEALFYLLTEGGICLIFQLEHIIAMFEAQLDLNTHILIMMCRIILILQCERQKVCQAQKQYSQKVHATTQQLKQTRYSMHIYIHLISINKKNDENSKYPQNIRNDPLCFLILFPTS